MAKKVKADLLLRALLCWAKATLLDFTKISAEFEHELNLILSCDHRCGNIFDRDKVVLPRKICKFYVSVTNINTVVAVKSNFWIIFWRNLSNSSVWLMASDVCLWQCFVVECLALFVCFLCALLCVHFLCVLYVLHFCVCIHCIYSKYPPNLITYSAAAAAAIASWHFS